MHGYKRESNRTLTPPLTAASKAAGMSTLKQLSPVLSTTRQQTLYIVTPVQV
ncbi:hypothetical protein HPP92_014680 [Vanilla planifolia]|uniref:Uncharacterized protein n=1 Tax=Vanilla planifolia TaxID=51239 RepID=A0A835USY7_VANPL|nr:hypothetical protein HPP92_014680 [Vanilla planifolia]